MSTPTEGAAVPPMTRNDIIAWAIAHAADGIEISRIGTDRKPGIRVAGPRSGGVQIELKFTPKAGAHTLKVLKRDYPWWFRAADGTSPRAPWEEKAPSLPTTNEGE